MGAEGRSEPFQGSHIRAGNAKRKVVSVGAAGFEPTTSCPRQPISDAIRARRRNHNRLGCASHGDRHGHGRVHPERSHLIRGRQHDFTAWVAAHDHGLAAQLRRIALLYRGEERIHIQVWTDLPPPDNNLTLDLATR